MVRNRTGGVIPPRARSLRGQALTLLALGLLFLGGPVPAVGQSRELIERGKYVFGATGGCGCHTEPGQALNAGGRRYDGPFGTVYSPNITPDPATGIGKWTDDQVITAVRMGRRPDGERLIPVHPYPSFNGMARDDLRALVAFLRTVPAASRAEIPKKILTPIFEHMLLPAWLAAFAPRGTSPRVAPTAGLTRGEYLVRAVGHCGECHTPRRMVQVMDDSRLLAGNKRGQGPEGKEVPNITPDKETGIGEWTEEQITEYLATGRRPDGDQAEGLMKEMIKGTAVGLKDLTKADRLAIASYLKSIPAIRNKVAE